MVVADTGMLLRQGVAEGDALEFELELVDFDKAPNWEAMGADAKIARAEALKEQGNRMFKAGPALFKHATQKWTKAIQLVDHAFDIATAEQVRLFFLFRDDQRVSDIDNGGQPFLNFIFSSGVI